MLDIVSETTPYTPLSPQERRKSFVAFVDPLQVEGDSIDEVEIAIPGRRSYTGSPVGVKDPIALQYIAAYFERHGYETGVLLRGLLGNEVLIERIREREDDLAAICIALHSTYLAPKARELARMLKAVMPEVPIIVGGYHPTGDPDIVLDEWIDYAVVGEGEESCIELVDILQSGTDLESIRRVRGIAFRDDGGQTMVTGPRPRVDYKSLPWPKREHDILALCRPGPLSYPPKGRVAQIAYSRGCPYGCTFCASPGMWKRKTSYRDADDLAAEMKHLITEHGVNNFFFCDLSFNGNRQRLLELCDSVERVKHEVGVPFGSHVMCTSTIIDPRILSRMKAANFWKIDYGIEDILEGTISRVKSFQKVSKIKETLSQTNEHGILMRGLMIIGFPWETEETIALREESIDQFPVDQLRICYFTPFKGTELYQEVKDRIIIDEGGYTTDRPPIRCDGIDTEGLRRAVPRLLKIFYNSPTYVATITEKCRRFPELADSYWHFYNYLKRKDLLNDDVYAELIAVAGRQRRLFRETAGPKDWAAASGG